MLQRIEAPPVEDELSPYRVFTRDEWAHLRADTPLTLTAADVARLQSLNDPISLDEVVAIYLPLSRLLSINVEASGALRSATNAFLGERTGRTPYVIGVAGFALPGNYVDIIVSTETEPPLQGEQPRQQSISKIVLERILVLAVAQEVNRDETKPKVVNAVTREVINAAGGRCGEAVSG